MDKKVEQTVRDYLNAQHLTYNTISDTWEGEIYADYYDELSGELIKKILQDDNPMDKFYELLSEIYTESEWDYQDELAKEMGDKWDEKTPWDEVEDDVRTFIQERVFYDYPADHYLNTTVEVDIMVDTGDGNYDFTLNSVYPHYDGHYGDTIDNHASILWLAKQLGYTKTQVNKALRDNEFCDSDFLRLLRQEVINCTTHMNAITFFAKMTLRDCIELNERLNHVFDKDEKNTCYYPWKSRNREFVVISKGTPCGLYDPWNGAGSVLELNIEKDIKLPLRYIDSAMPDGCRGYSVSKIYGMCMSFWRNTPKLA